MTIAGTLRTRPDAGVTGGLLLCMRPKWLVNR